MHQEKRLFVSKQALQRSKVISEYVEGSLLRKEAAAALCMSQRQLSRLAARFQKNGIMGLEHLNAGKANPKSTPPEIRERITYLYQQKYINFNFKHFHEIVTEQEKIDIGYSTIKRICSKLGNTKKPRRKKIVRKNRKRYGCPGLMIQMDGSEHPWVPGKVWVLIAGIDDATSEVSYGEFFNTEGLQGYLAVLKQIIKIKGIPKIIYVDHAAWLSGTSKNDESGQFKRICEELGITLMFANSPQAKGRVERLWQTLQDRLVAELAYHKIATIEEANHFLNQQFLPNTWNRKFTVPPQSEETCYRPSPSPEALEEIFCFKYRRKVRNDHTILWGNRLYKFNVDLGYSIAKREIEIRYYMNDTIAGYYAGINLQLRVINRPEDRPAHLPILSPFLEVKSFRQGKIMERELVNN